MCENIYLPSRFPSIQITPKFLFPLTGDGLVFFVSLMSHNLLLPARLHTDSPVGWFCFHSYTFIAVLTAIVCGSRVCSTRSR